VVVLVRPQVLVAPTEGARASAVAFALEPAQENQGYPDRAPWQDLRLFGRGRDPRRFKAGAEQIGDLYL
jgi:hypothetical protein